MNDKSPVFLKTFCLISALISIAIILLNITIDPYGLFGTPKIQGINSIKPRMRSNIRMVKAHQVNRIQPHGLILGASRAEIGLDPNHPGWSEQAKPVYNLALPSARIYEIYEYLQHAQAQSRLVQVVLGLDFFMFDANHPMELGFDTARLDDYQHVIPNSGMLEDYLRALLSYNSLFASFETLTKQELSAFGYLDNGSPDLRNKHRIIHDKGGYYYAFEATLKTSLLSEDGLNALEYGQKNGRKYEALKWFRNIVRFCMQENIELYILLSPLHAQWLEAMWQLGVGNDYESWKRDIVRIVEEARMESKDETTIELWDFSGYNQITQEVVPKKGDTSTDMEWYWEASHYKRSAGYFMLDRALVGIKGTEYSEFGVQLTSDNIESHLENIRNASQKYKQNRPEEVVYIKTLISKTLP